MAKTSSATASKGGKSISVTRNSNGSYSISSGGRTVRAANASSARQAISSMANSSGGGKGGWSISSNGSSGGGLGGSSVGSTNSSYRGAGGTGLTGTDWGKTYADNADIQSAISKYGKDKVYDALDYLSTGGRSNSQVSYLLTGNPNSNTSLGGNSTATNPNTTGNKSGIGATRKVNGIDYTSSSVDSYLKSKEHFLNQGMSQEDADKKARTFLEAPTVSTTKEEENAMQYGPTEDDTDTSGYDELTGNYQDEPTNQDNERIDTDAIIDEWLYNNYGMDQNSLQNTMDRLTSKDTESKVINNKAEAPDNEAFNFNTYFKENNAPDANVGETGEVKAETPAPNAPLTDVTKYQDEAISSLQSLGFLEPDTAAAESMPDTEEQAPETLAEDTPEALVQGFDEKMDELEQMGGEQGLTPQAVARTYVDYKNRLAKYIKDNNIPDDQAAAMFDQLKNNEKFRNFLQANRR